MGGEFVRGRVCQGPSLLGAVMSRNNPDIACADPESFVRGGPTFFMSGERVQIAIKAGNHRPASETPFKWRFAGLNGVSLVGR